MNFKLRLLLLTCVWFSLSALLLGTLFFNQQQTTEQRTQQNLHRELAAHMRDDNPLMHGTDYNPDALKTIFHTLMLLGPDFEIYFLDQQGNIRSHAAPDGKVKMDKVNLSPIKHFMDQASFPILGDDPRHPQQQKVFSVAPISQFGSVIGYLYVVIGSEQHSLLEAQESYQPLLITLFTALILLIGFSLVTYLLVKRTLLKPIEQVAQRLQAQAGNDFRLQPDFVHQVPELMPIASHFYQMAQRIQQQFLQLQYQETTRREMLMQLSHDLKTPLSSILGYLETWQLQAEHPDPLIETAHRNAQKLGDQLHQQLQLAHSKQPDPKPCFEQVDLANIIDETAESLAIDAQRKNITFNISIPTIETIYGDKQLLLRLFANLLENAIRHSPGNACIYLKVVQHTDDININITNHIDHTAPSGSLGLGTKIIQSILMLHHSQLLTEQAPDSFNQSFRLPIH
ncbi:HAMP domain-containing histidine kinase [Photobacterium sagamiensis]|uniref:sensor histidine kinase n=1 Tax=Photobacterium sagamiensis TaxID=2910241 RepID=UPI003D0DE57B